MTESAKKTTDIDTNKGLEDIECFYTQLDDNGAYDGCMYYLRDDPDGFLITDVEPNTRLHWHLNSIQYVLGALWGSVQHNALEIDELIESAQTEKLSEKFGVN